MLFLFILGLLFVTVYWLFGSHPRSVVCRLGRFKWDTNEFCRGWLITGSTGSGKTTSGINHLMHQVFSSCNGKKDQYPKWGGVYIDEKGVYVDVLQAMAKHYGREEDLIILSTSKEGKTRVQFNLIGNRLIPSSTYASLVGKTTDIVSQRCVEERGFFQIQSETHIARAIDFLRHFEDLEAAAGIEVKDRLGVGLDGVVRLLTNKLFYDELVARCNFQKPKLYETKRDIWENIEEGIKEFNALYWSQPPEQLGGVQGNIHNNLAHFVREDIREIFCRGSTFNFGEIDTGKIICLQMPQSLNAERRSICAFLKALFYIHSLRRFDLPKKSREGLNLIILWQDEAQRFISEMDGDVDVIREIRATTVMACQSQTSLIPAFQNKERRDAILLNIRNRIIFRSADERCAEASASYIGKAMKVKKSFTKGQSGVITNSMRQEDYIVSTSQLRSQKDFMAYICTASGAHRRYLVEPILPAGKCPDWWAKRLFFSYPWKWIMKTLFQKRLFI